MKIEPAAPAPEEPEGGWTDWRGNERSSAIVLIDCPCRHFNPGCVNCHGTGQQRKIGCRRCKGTGREGGPCPDCRGDGWRALDQPGAFL